MANKVWKRATKARDLYAPSFQVGVECKGVGRTKQSFKAQCDVNNIIKKYDKTGLLAHVNTMKAQYGDFSKVGDFREALDKMAKAEEAFMEMPPKLRKRFRNDPMEMVAFLSDKANKAEAIELGLVEKPKDPEILVKPGT